MLRDLDHHVDDNDSLYHVASAEDQVLSDVAVEREQRREQQGFVTPSQAATFLGISRRVHLRGQSAPSRDGVTAGYFRNLERRADSGNAVAPGRASAGRRQDRNVRALPGTGGSGRLSSIVEQLQYLGEHDEAAYFSRLEELGYLATEPAAPKRAARRRVASGLRLRQGSGGQVSRKAVHIARLCAALKRAAAALAVHGRLPRSGKPSRLIPSLTLAPAASTDARGRQMPGAQMRRW